MTKEVMAVLGGLVATIIVFTVLAGGNIALGTSGQGPYANFGFRGPQNR